MALRILCRLQQDHKSVWQAGDGEPCVGDKTLMNTQLVRTVRGDNADAARAKFDFVPSAIRTLDDKGPAFGDVIQGDTVKQPAILIDFRGIAVVCRRTAPKGEQ